MKANRLRIKLRAYDHRLLDRSAAAIVRGVVKTGAIVSGPIPLPTKRSVVTVLRSPHVDKKSREQFEMRVHSRLIEILDPNEETAAALRSQDVPAGVDVEIVDGKHDVPASVPLDLLAGGGDHRLGLVVRKHLLAT